MAKRKRKVHKRPAAKAASPIANAASSAADAQIDFSGLSLHDLFQQQTMTMLDSTDLSEEQKQGILVAMSCPCCGAGGMSFTAKIKRRS